MNIESIAMENICNNMIKDFSHYFDWNNIGINYSIINAGEKTVNTISSNYE